MWYKAQFREWSDQGQWQESNEQPSFGVGEANKIKSMELAAGTAIENYKLQADDRALIEWPWLHYTNGDDETKTA